MRSQIKIDRRNCYIIVNSGFAKRADSFGTDEYYDLQNCRQAYPDFKVVTRRIRKNPNKESFAGLTFSYMEKYIRIRSASSEELESTMREFENLKLIAECHSKARQYPAIKRWFLNKYPEIAQFGLIDLEQKVLLLPYSNTVALPEPEIA